MKTNPNRPIEGGLIIAAASATGARAMPLTIAISQMNAAPPLARLANRFHEACSTAEASTIASANVVN